MKKLLSLMLVLGMLLSAGSALAETVALKVWGSQDDQAMLQEMVEAFKAANPDKNTMSALALWVKVMQNQIPRRPGRSC